MKKYSNIIIILIFTFLLGLLYYNNIMLKKQVLKNYTLMINKNKALIDSLSSNISSILQKVTYILLKKITIKNQILDYKKVNNKIDISIDSLKTELEKINLKILKVR